MNFILDYKIDVNSNNRPKYLSCLSLTTTYPYGQLRITIDEDGRMVINDGVHIIKIGDPKKGIEVTNVEEIPTKIYQCSCPFKKGDHNAM